MLIEDEEGQLVPPGTVGEIAVKSPGLTSGYSDMEELNRQAFRDGFFLSGDLGQLDEDGRLTITRKKLLIEVGATRSTRSRSRMSHTRRWPRPWSWAWDQGSRRGAGQGRRRAQRRDDEKELIGFCQQRLANFKVPQVVESGGNPEESSERSSAST